MTDYSRKLLFQQNLAGIIDNQIASAKQGAGYELPCIVKEISADGLFVTVDFAVAQGQFPLPTITIPIAESEYVRLPIQVGTVGVTKKIDVNIQNISGQADGVAGYTNYGNLDAVLCFVPISNSKLFPSNEDINSLWLYGPNGVKIQDLQVSGGTQTSNSSVTLTPNDIVIKYGLTETITMSAIGTVINSGLLSSIVMTAESIVISYGTSAVITLNSSGIQISGTTVLDGVTWDTHVHSDPQGGKTGGPANP